MSSWLYLDDYPFNMDGSTASTTSGISSTPTFHDNLWYDPNFKDLSNGVTTDISGFDDFLFDENTTHQITATTTSSSSSPILPHTPTDILNSIQNAPFLGEDESPEFVNNTLNSQSLYITYNGTIFPPADQGRLQFSPTLTEPINPTFSMDFDFKGPLADDISINNILPPSPKSNASPGLDITPKSIGTITPSVTTMNSGNSSPQKKLFKHTHNSSIDINNQPADILTSTPAIVTSISSGATSTTTTTTTTTTSDSIANPISPSQSTSPIPKPARKHSESRMSLPELYNLMGLAKDPTEARIREKRILDLLQKEGFLLGQRTWIRDTDQNQRKTIINNIYNITYDQYHYEKDLIELIIRRGTYYIMQGRLRRLRRKRAQNKPIEDEEQILS